MAGALVAPSRRISACTRITSSRGWLGDIVVRSHPKARQLVRLIDTPGQHEDRHGADGAQAAGDFEAIDARQVEVQDDQIGGMLGGELEGVKARGGLHGFEVIQLEVLSDQFADVGIVLDDHDPAVRADDFVARRIDVNGTHLGALLCWGGNRREGPNRRGTIDEVAPCPPSGPGKRRAAAAMGKPCNRPESIRLPKS
jgi:hypothetical protein